MYMTFSRQKALQRPANSALFHSYSYYLFIEDPFFVVLFKTQLLVFPSEIKLYIIESLL